MRFDSYWYHDIAVHGYSYAGTTTEQSNVAFFPAYPIAMRGAGRFMDYPLAGITVTVASAIGAVTMFTLWLRMNVRPSAVLTAVALFLLYPYGWYLYGAVYSDALFLCVVLAAFLLVESKHPVLAGLAGVVATACRPVGLAVVLGLTVRMLERRGALAVPSSEDGVARPPGLRRLLAWARVPTGFDRRRLKASDAGILLSVGGLAAYCIYLWQRFGNPFLFSAVEESWGQPERPYTWSKRALVEFLLHGDDKLYAWGGVVQGVLALATLAAVPFIARRFGWGYGIYVFVAVGIPAVGSKDFQGLGRYLIAAFPLFALLGERLADSTRARAVVLPCSTLLLVMMTAGFAHGLYLS
jgi:hypothetical protein